MKTHTKKNILENESQALFVRSFIHFILFRFISFHLLVESISETYLDAIQKYKYNMYVNCYLNDVNLTIKSNIYSF